MNSKEYLLTQAASECVEVAHSITKALHFGLTDTEPGKELNNAKRIVGEFIELCAVMQMLEDDGLLDLLSGQEALAQMEHKRARVEHFMAYARQCGTLSE